MKKRKVASLSIVSKVSARSKSNPRMGVSLYFGRRASEREKKGRVHQGTNMAFGKENGTYHLKLYEVFTYLYVRGSWFPKSVASVVEPFKFESVVPSTRSEQEGKKTGHGPAFRKPRIISMRDQRGHRLTGASFIAGIACGLVAGSCGAGALTSTHPRRGAVRLPYASDQPKRDLRLSFVAAEVSMHRDSST